MFRGRILLVDDEPSVLSLYSRSLTDAGFEVEEASNGADALHRAEGRRFDAVLSDVSMPRMDGLALLKKLRNRSPELPVVLMQNGPDNLTTIRATQLGAVQCLIKPISADLLAQTADYAVGLSRSRHSAPPGSDSRRAPQKTSSVTATEAKNDFGRILEEVTRGGTVVITKHDTPKAVLISVQQFDSLSRANEDRLDTLSGEFDALLARMQTATSRAGMDAAFGASPQQLSEVALRAMRGRE